MDKPRCFQECKIKGCSMQTEHCGANDYPAMSRCIRCNYYFGKLEKEGAK